MNQFVTRQSVRITPSEVMQVFFIVEMYDENLAQAAMINVHYGNEGAIAQSRRCGKSGDHCGSCGGFGERGEYAGSAVLMD